jgi:aspartate dehydrogenase
VALSVIVEHECKKSSRTLHKSQSAAPSLPAAARSILRVHRRPHVRRRRQDIAIRDDKIHRIGRDLDGAGHATIGVPDTLVRGPRPASSLEARQMKQVGLIGCGAIGRPVARALLAGKAGAHSLAAVLARAPRDLDGFPVTDTADRFLAGGHDLIIEAGGPAAFRALVPAALERCEVWAVSPIPLTDPVLEREIRGISASTGHALRIAPGALAAFDGIATAMAGGLDRLDVFIDLGAGEASEPELLFEGTAREVGLRFPEGVNVVIAAALAGPGLDATHVRVMRPPRGSVGRTMGFTVRSRAGVFELMARPRVVRAEDIHTVAASLIAMLRRETAGIVIG